MRPVHRHIYSTALAIIALVTSLVATIGASAAPTQPIAPLPASYSGPAGPENLETLFDDLLARQLKEYAIPGATVAVVQGGRLVFAKGYGYANLERRTPMVADQTLVRVGSVAKLFTWTAVLQLAEQGKLDLNADVNTYLPNFQIPATYPEPITLAHLLTHTAGFEDRQLGITVAHAEDLEPLGRYVADVLPARIFPPGTVTAYSNYGAALAGAIVEHVSGEPFAEYVRQHIFAPLGMRRSTFAQQLPSELAARLAASYDSYDAAYHAMPFEYFQSAPAGGLSATATDMAQFMVAQLQDGQLGDARILQAATAQDMHRQHFTNDPHVNGMTYGFAEMTLNGQRLLVHSGTTNDELFRSLLVLLPEHNMGLFVSYTGAGGGDAKWALLQALLDRSFPAGKLSAPVPPADFAQRAGQFTGSYRSTRMAATTIEKIQALFAPEVRVSASDDGYLVVAGLTQEPTRWAETEPLIFRQVGGQESMAFRANAQGQMAYLFASNLPINGYRKLPWYEALSFHYGLLIASVALFLSALVTWPAGWMLARRRRTPQPRLAALARWLAWWVSALQVVFLISFAISISDLSQFPTPLTKAALGIALLATTLTLGMVACAGQAWRRRYWSVLGRVHYSLVTLGALGFVWFLSQWNLLGFR